MSRQRGRSGLIIVGVLLALLLLVADLVRSDSFILGSLQGAGIGQVQETRGQRLIRLFRGSRSGGATSR